jgi:major vault protein
VLKETIGLHLRTEKNFEDVYGIKRRAGEEWLVTNENSELHILDIYEILVAQVKAVSLGSREYCVIENPRA